ncbi:MAG: HAMP domain-containing protein, partial [Beijerinckiaceae bacterium]
MSIFKRILLACSLIVLVGLIQTAFMVYGTSGLTHKIEKASIDPVRQLDAAHSAWDGFRNAEIMLGEVLDAIRFRDAGDAIAKFSVMMAGVEAKLGEVETIVETDKAKADLVSTRKVIGEWKGNALVLLGAAPATAIPAPHIMTRLTGQVRQHLETLVANAKADAAIARSDIMGEASSLNRLFIALGLLGLGLGLGLAFLLARALTKPLSTLERKMRAIAAGDVGVEIDHLGRKDEIGSMAQALAVFRDNAVEAERLRQETMRIETERVAEKAREMEALALAFEQSVASVVAAVSNSARNMRENLLTLTESTRQADDEAAKVVSTSHETTANVRSAAVAAEQLSASVLDIASQTELARRMSGDAAGRAHQSVQIVSNLSQSVSQIGDVVKI